MPENVEMATAITAEPPQGAQEAGSGWARWRGSIGPGLVFVMSVAGTAEIVSNSAAGASYGYSLIWAVGLAVIFRYVWVGTSAKYVLVTGETLLQGYGRLGNWLVWVVLAGAVLYRHVTNLYKIAIMGSAADALLHLPTAHSAAVWSLFLCSIAFAMMFWGGYPVVERSCKFLIAIMGGSMVAAALFSHPQPAAILRGALIPGFPKDQGFHSVVLLITALIGSGAGSMTNLTYSYFIYEKGWRDVSCLKRQRFDLGLSAIFIFLMSALLQIAAAGTVHPLGIKLENADSLVQIFERTLGLPGRIIFALGLWAAAFSGFISGTMGYGLMVRDICRRFVPRLKRSDYQKGGRQEAKRDAVYRWFIVFGALSPLYILFTGVGPVRLVLVVSSFVVILIPILALALLKITNDERLMGKYKNGLPTNATILLLVCISAYFSCKNGLDLLHKLL